MWLLKVELYFIVFYFLFCLTWTIFIFSFWSDMIKLSIISEEKIHFSKIHIIIKAEHGINHLECFRLIYLPKIFLLFIINEEQIPVLRALVIQMMLHHVITRAPSCSLNLKTYLFCKSDTGGDRTAAKGNLEQKWSHLFKQQPVAPFAWHLRNASDPLLCLKPERL